MISIAAKPHNKAEMIRFSKSRGPTISDQELAVKVSASVQQERQALRSKGILLRRGLKSRCCSAVGSLRDLQTDGWTITLYCQGNCTHRWSPSWNQMIQYFWPDYDLVARACWGRPICKKCGHRGAMVIVQPSTGTTHGIKGGGGHNHQAGMSIEEATGRYHEFHAEQRQLGIKKTPR